MVTVAAVILSATEDGALADTLGQPRVRRLVDIAWSGGALPIVVLSPDPTGRVAAALAGTEASHGTPAPPEAGPVGQMVRGIELAQAEVGETTAALLWPARMTWVGPETITSLIETHGTDPAVVLRPSWHGGPGWPVLVPTADLDALRRVPAELMPAEVIETLISGVASRLVELGDPGVVHSVDTPLVELPPYEGPPEPPGVGAHEWGAEVAAEAGLPEPGGSPTR
jgi:CTP:molybdopterin cytidylyltransferase MocA